jgi:hypothetical protein
MALKEQGHSLMNIFPRLWKRLKIPFTDVVSLRMRQLIQYNERKTQKISENNSFTHLVNSFRKHIEKDELNDKFDFRVFYVKRWLSDFRWNSWESSKYRTGEHSSFSISIQNS